MTDWKKRIDDWRQKQTTESEEGIRKEEERKLRGLRAQAEERKRKEACHICKKPADVSYGIGFNPGVPGKSAGRDQPFVSNNSTGKCSICGKWTCSDYFDGNSKKWIYSDCMHDWICKKCAGKLR